MLRAAGPQGFAGPPTPDAGLWLSDGQRGRAHRPGAVYLQSGPQQLYRRGHSGAAVPRFAHGALPGAGGPLRCRGKAGGPGGIHEKGLPQRPAGPCPGGGGGGPLRGPEPGTGPPRGRPAGRGPVRADRGDLVRPSRRDGPLPRRFGLPGRGHRPLPSGGAGYRPGRSGGGAVRPAGHLRPGTAPAGRGGLRDRGPAQRGQVLPPQRHGGLGPGHRHRDPRHHPGHGGGAVRAGGRPSASH